MNAATLARFPCANSSAVSFHDGQLGWILGGLDQFGASPSSRNSASSIPTWCVTRCTVLAETSLPPTCFSTSDARWLDRVSAEAYTILCVIAGVSSRLSNPIAARRGKKIPPTAGTSPFPFQDGDRTVGRENRTGHQLQRTNFATGRTGGAVGTFRRHLPRSPFLKATTPTGRQPMGSRLDLTEMGRGSKA